MEKVTIADIINVAAVLVTCRQYKWDLPAIEKLADIFEIPACSLGYIIQQVYGECIDEEEHFDDVFTEVWDQRYLLLKIGLSEAMKVWPDIFDMIIDALRVGKLDVENFL